MRNFKLSAKIETRVFMRTLSKQHAGGLVQTIIPKFSTFINDLIYVAIIVMVYSLQPSRTNGYIKQSNVFIFVVTWIPKQKLFQKTEYSFCTGIQVLYQGGLYKILSYLRFCFSMLIAR